MDVNAKLIKDHRVKNNWTQQHLADACGLSLRTIQRVERYGNASNETVSALAAVFEITSELIVVLEVIEENSQETASSLWIERVILTIGSGITGYVIAMLTL